MKRSTQMFIAAWLTIAIQVMAVAAIAISVYVLVTR